MEMKLFKRWLLNWLDISVENVDIFLYLLYFQTCSISIGFESSNFSFVCFCLTDCLCQCVIRHVVSMCVCVRVCFCTHTCLCLHPVVPSIGPPTRTVTPFISPWSASHLSDGFLMAPRPSRPSRLIWRTAASSSNSNRYTIPLKRYHLLKFFVCCPVGDGSDLKHHVFWVLISPSAPFLQMQSQIFQTSPWT